MKAQSKCALTNRVVLRVEIRALETKNSCSVSCSMLLLQNVLDRAGMSPAHHALLSAVFVCMTLLCSAEIRVFGKPPSSSLPFSSEKIFLQWERDKVQN